MVQAGYEPIKVPGRLYEIFEGENGKNTQLRHILNYLNANTFINKNNELVYITNKSDIDDKLSLSQQIKSLTGISIEKELNKHIKNNVDKFYTVSGEDEKLSKFMLRENGGGIHCMCAEVTK